jgi:hypothetical protein
MATAYCNPLIVQLSIYTLISSHPNPPPTYIPQLVLFIIGSPKPSGKLQSFIVALTI